MKRRITNPFRIGVPLAVLLALAGCGSETPSAKNGTIPASPESHYNLLVGTYTEGPASSGKSQGIPVFRFDTTTGELTPLANNDGIRNPSWLVVTPSGRHVYAVNELNGTGKSGEVSAFDFDPTTGKLGFINKVSSEGDDPCHLLLDENFGRLFVSNYTGGSFSILGLESTGRLSSPVLTDRHAALGDTNPHVHSVVLMPGNEGYVVQDLGLNQITYFEQTSGRHSVSFPADIGLHKIKLSLPAYTGPRHLIFDTTGNHAYLIGETTDSVMVLNDGLLHCDWIDRPLSPSQTLPLGAPVEPGKGTAAAIHISDDGRFLYASTRNPKNILVVFAVSPADGTLREIQTVSSGGKAPREFAIAPGGKFLLVANQQSDAIAVFSRDPETGKIADTGRRIPVGSPTDLKWTPAK